MMLLGHFHIQCSLTQPPQDLIYFNSSKEMWSILSEFRVNLIGKNKLRIIIFSYLHLLPDTQSLECSFSDLKNLVLKDKMKCEKKPLLVGSLFHGYRLSWSIKMQNKPCDIGGPYYTVTPVQMMGPVSAGDLLRAKCGALFPSPHPRRCLYLNGN